VPAGASGSVSYECTVQNPLPLGMTKITNTGTIDSNETDPEQDTETALTACFDFNGNGAVDIGDIMQVAIRWLLTAANPDPDNNPATPNYEAQYDVNGDGVITVVDIMMVAAQWGQTCP
jgi:Ca2+-binding EF-hand superfamily protein